MTIPKIKIPEHFYNRRGKSIPQAPAFETKRNAVDHLGGLVVCFENMLMPPIAIGPRTWTSAKCEFSTNASIAPTRRVLPNKDNLRTGAQRQINALEIHPRKKNGLILLIVLAPAYNAHTFSSGAGMRNE
jgi:hypothetical protein